MSVLTTKQRDRLSDSKFGLPEKRAYPIQDEAHARNALARAAQDATPAEQAEIRRRVHALYPAIKVAGRKGAK